MTDGERLAVIETKVDTLTELVTVNVQDTKDVLEKHDIRLRSLERFRNILTGGILVVSGGGAAIYKFLTGAS